MAASDTDFRAYLRFLLGTAFAFALAVAAFILVLDPYQTVSFSPPLARAPVSQNQRFAYPAIARNPAFDGLIIGTSTARLLDPERVGEPLGARLANLAMNSATAYEQARIHELFVRHHPGMRYLVVGVDETWCSRDESAPRYTFRQFPEWLYDRSRTNDLLYLFNDKALENAVRMLELLLGRREPKYRRDGYRDFTAEFGEHDLGAVRKRLYPRGGEPPPAAPIEPARQHADWHFPQLDGLEQLLGRTPAGARVVLLFPPLHAAYLAPRAAALAECKGRIHDRFAAADKALIVDFMHLSDLTLEDRNYWDPVHFTAPVARRLEAAVAARLAGADDPPATDRTRD